MKPTEKVGRRAARQPVRSDPKASGLGELAGRRFAGAAILLDLETDLLSLNEARHSGALRGRDMDEYVGASGIRLNEAVSLLTQEVIELWLTAS